MKINTILFLFCVGIFPWLMDSCDPMSTSTLIVNNDSELTLQCIIAAKFYESTEGTGSPTERIIELKPHQQTVIYNVTYLGRKEIGLEALEGNFIQKLAIIDGNNRELIVVMPVINSEFLSHIKREKSKSSYIYILNIDSKLVEYLSKGGVRNGD